MNKLIEVEKKKRTSNELPSWRTVLVMFLYSCHVITYLAFLKWELDGRKVVFKSVHLEECEW